MNEGDKLATEAVGELLRLEQQSSLPTNGYFKALVRVASNDAILRAALHNGDVTMAIPDPTKSQQPINLE